MDEEKLKTYLGYSIGAYLIIIFLAINYLGVFLMWLLKNFKDTAIGELFAWAILYGIIFTVMLPIYPLLEYYDKRGEIKKEISSRELRDSLLQFSAIILVSSIFFYYLAGVVWKYLSGILGKGLIMIMLHGFPLLTGALQFHILVGSKTGKYGRWYLLALLPTLAFLLGWITNFYNL